MTAVEWLIEQFKNTFSEYIKLNPDWEVLQQAKAMESEQMNEIHLDGIEQGYNMRYEQEKKMKHDKDV